MIKNIPTNVSATPNAYRHVNGSRKTTMPRIDASTSADTRMVGAATERFPPLAKTNDNKTTTRLNEMPTITDANAPSVVNTNCSPDNFCHATQMIGTMSTAMAYTSAPKLLLMRVDDNFKKKSADARHSTVKNAYT